MAKLPKPDLVKIASGEPVYAERSELLWRIHTAVGPHQLAWDALRTAGPLDMRFDPWLGDVAHPVVQEGGVGYFGYTWDTCLAEVFQIKRVVDLTRPGKQISGFEPTRPLRLLDLTGGYPITVGASHKINSGNKDRCREWAIAFTAVFPDLDGMLYTGMTGNECVVLYGPAMDAFPLAPLFSKSLEDRVIRDRVAQAATKINYDVLA